MQQAESTTAAKTVAADGSTGQVAARRSVPTRLERLKARDRSAQEVLYRERRRELEALARSVLECRVDAASLVADVFTDFLFRYVDTIREEAAMYAYLRMMTIRRARRQNELHGRHDNVADHEGIPAGDADPLQAADARIWAGWLDDCVEGLPQKNRRLLRLRFGHDLNLDEIGSEAGVSKQAVSKTIQKSLAVLRRCLEGKRANHQRAER